LPRLALVASAGDFAVVVEEAENDGALVRVRGELDLATAGDLEAALERTGARGRVVIDLSECEFLDSSGIRVLLTEAGRCESEGGSLAVVAPHPRVRRPLELAEVDSWLSIHASLEAARER
jgi:anti-sigma B factor antagonist